MVVINLETRRRGRTEFQRRHSTPWWFWFLGWQELTASQLGRTAWTSGSGRGSRKVLVNASLHDVLNDFWDVFADFLYIDTVSMLFVVLFAILTIIVADSLAKILSITLTAFLIVFGLVDYAPIIVPMRAEEFGFKQREW
jgi:hypothetical protein